MSRLITFNIYTHTRTHNTLTLTLVYPQMRIYEYSMHFTVIIAEHQLFAVVWSVPCSHTYTCPYTHVFCWQHIIRTYAYVYVFLR